MKIRNGFISNSSSSSFIIALEKIPETKEEVTEIFTSYEYRVSDEAKQQILNDIQQTIPLNEKDLLEEVSTGWIENYNIESDEIKKYRSPTKNGSYHYDWEKYKQDIKNIRSIKLEEFKKDNPKATIFVAIDYSDNDGDFGSYMEHDLPWDYSKKVIVISQH